MAPVNLLISINHMAFKPFKVKIIGKGCTSDEVIIEATNPPQARKFAELRFPGSSGSRIVYTPGVFCPLWDPWGIINYNESHNVQCIPVPYGPWASTYDGEMLW